jgi:thioredoxin 2
MSEIRQIVCPHCTAINRTPADRPAEKARCGACRNPLFGGKPVAASAESFATHVQRNDIPVVADFWADWCGPCKMMAPFVDEIAAQYIGKALVAKLDTDHAQKAAAPFGIRGIPTTIVFKGGKAVAQRTGAMKKEGLEELLKQAF